MAEKKKKKEKNKGSDGGGDPNKLTKEEDAIARFVRFNCPTNTTMFEGNEVHYFSGKKAVDVLVESKKYGATAKRPKFNDAEEAEDFLQSLLQRGLFFRTKKLVPKKKDKDQQKVLEKGRDVSKSPRVGKTEQKKGQQKEEAKEKEGGGTQKEEEQQHDKDEEREREEEKKDQQEEEKKKKKKVKLLFHDIQSFDVNASDVYVWIFDPTPLWKKCVGILIVLGTIGGCLFPLWPDWLRLGIYYLSVTGIALFGLLLGVALARTILFGLIWLFTLGRHHLWLLPNLMEDCGFFESFQPVYTYEYVEGGVFAKKDQKKKKKGKSNEEGGEEEEEKKENEADGKGGEYEEEKEPLMAQQEQKHETTPETVNPAPPHQDDEKEQCTKLTETQQHHEGIERKSSSESEGKQSTKGTSGGSDEEEGEEGESQGGGGTDDSNSWEKLSENSQKSSAEGGGKKKEEGKA